MTIKREEKKATREQEWNLQSIHHVNAAVLYNYDGITVHINVIPT